MQNIVEFELLDLLDKTKNIKYLRDYIKIITNNKETIDVEKYLLLKVNSKSVLEILSKNWDKLSVIYNTKPIKEMILSNDKLLEECIKIDFIKILKDVPNDIFKTKIKDTTLIEYLLQNNKVSKKNIDILLPCENIFYYIKKYNKEYLLEDINLNKFANLDDLIDSKIDIKSQKLDIQIINKIINKKAYYLLSDLDENELLKKIDNKTILEILLENNIIPKEKEYTKIQSIKLLVKYEKYELLQKTKQEYLFIKDENDKYIIDEYLKRGYRPYGMLYQEPIIVYYIIKNNRSDLYQDIMYSTLVNNEMENKLFLDIVLEEYKKDNTIKLPKIIRILTYSDLAKVYICYAKHGLEGMLPHDFKIFLSLDENKEKTLLEYLLEEDEIITKNIIIPDLINYKEFELLIKIHEYKKQFPNIDNILSDIEKEQKERYSVNYIDAESEILIKELINLFSDDNQDKKISELLELNYRYLCSIDKENLNEVKRLIELKEEIPHFSLSSSRENSYYKNERISLDIPNIEVLNHELGHLFFHLNANEYIPSNIDAVVFKIANDKNFTDNKIELFTRITDEVLKDINEESKRIINLLYTKENTEEYRKEIEEYLNDVDLPEWILNSINKNTNYITSEEFIKKDKQIKQREIRNYFLHYRYQGLLIISDIIDAICEGKYYDKQIKDKNGNILRGIGGHGIEYYTNDKDNIFKEVIANYNSLIKLKDNEKYIKILRDIVGNELVDLLNTYYNENIRYTDYRRIK